jgi:DNA-directed RNA polymerase subunit RPC12/RpoP
MKRESQNKWRSVTMAAKKKHVRIVCPHCGKRISLAQPRNPLGWIRPVPCPSCHIPIDPAHIKAQLEPPPQATETEVEEQREKEVTPEATEAASTKAESVEESSAGEGA